MNCKAYPRPIGTCSPASALLDEEDELDEDPYPGIGTANA